MPASPRHRFIRLVVLAYCVLAALWILLSDSLLLLVADADSMVVLSTYKGLVFVLGTAALLYFSLGAVPADNPSPAAGLLESWAERLAKQSIPRWLAYLFALAVSLATLGLRDLLPISVSQQPMLILFMLPILLSALLGGMGPGLLATILTVLGVDEMASPAFHTAQADPGLRLQWGFLLLCGVAISLFSGWLRRLASRNERHRRLLDAVVSGTSDAVFVKDRQGRYLMLNDAAATIVGRPADEVLGQNDHALFDSDSATRLMQVDEGIMRSGVLHTHEEHLRLQDGTALVFLVTKGPVLSADGEVVGLFGISRDISQQKQDEQTLRLREQQLARVLEGSDQGYWDWNIQTDDFEISHRWKTMLGYAADAQGISREDWLAMIHPQDLPQVIQAMQAHLAGETPAYEMEMRCRSQTGNWRWILSRGRVLSRDDAGRPLIMSGTHTDITERKIYALAQREAAVVFDSSYEGIMVVSPAGVITKVNAAFTRITGYPEAEVLGQSPNLLSSGLHGPAFYQALWMQVKQQDFWRGEIWNRRRDGELYAELLSISVVRDQQGQIQHYVGIFSDITQLKAHEAELDRIANYDPLTNIPNRRLLSDRLEQALLHCRRHEKYCAVCFLDLDGFKAINDLYGHDVGDQLLVALAERLKSVLRADDTLARLGGDEFVLLLSDLNGAAECMPILDRLLATVRQEFMLGDVVIRTSASIGISLFPLDDADADTLLRHADQAMYQAKESGKNCYLLFDPENDRRAQQHRGMLAMLEMALACQQFVLYYQPKVDLRDGRLVGVEALIRWQHPEQGLLAPAAFLPALQGSELEMHFGRWVLDAAVAQLAQWQSEGMAMSVSINVAARYLLHPDFFDHIQQALTRYPAVLPGMLELEVLESAALDDLAQALQVLQRCSALGVHFALDDFGTGYSSLTYLRQLPVDTLKIDQSFVRGMLEDRDDLGIVASVIQLAGVFRRQVIAEGVETLAHGVALGQMGCHLVQGYGIARPMPAAEIPGWAEQWQQQGVWRQLASSEI
ncbi:diguanylate cyclase (GGDEF)-like protein/PAS domain S-box-containing protein [Vogesella perlucida]|nr:diguanylate cyclase (GGDEF)-like protein/PAS domain S-box-containing protein [Vogesella perlucida]